jgi:hypothetical protein
MKTVGFYHIYCTVNNANWANIFLDQMTTAENSGLLDALDALHIVVIGDMQRAKLLTTMLEVFDSKHKFFLSLHPWEQDSDVEMCRKIDFAWHTERMTHHALWEYCNLQNTSCAVLYFHTKGITAFNRHLDFTEDATTYANYYYWRKFLDWGMLTNWEKHVGNLNKTELSGVNYMTTPAPHFSGGYFWARADYIRKLPDPYQTQWWGDLQAKTQDAWLKTAPSRFADEMWVGSVPHSVWSWKGQPEGTNLSVKTLKPKDYIG